MNILPEVGNIGAGAGQVFKQKTASNLHELRSIKAGANVTVTNNANDIEIAASGGGASTMTWQETWPFNSSPDNTSVSGRTHMTNMNLFTQGEAISSSFTQNKQSAWFQPHPDIVSSASVQFRAFGFYRTAAQLVAESVTFTFRAYWRGQDETLDPTPPTSAATATSTAVTVLHPAWLTNWATITPGGTQSDDRYIWCGFQCGGNDNLMNLAGITIRYTINLGS